MAQAPLPLPPVPPIGDGGGDALSPTTILMNFLRSRGGLSGPNVAANIRTALEENARNPGYIPGLSNTPEADSTPRVGGGGGGSVAGKVEGNLPVPPVPPDYRNPNTPVDASNPQVLPGELGGAGSTSGGKPTSAQPSESIPNIPTDPTNPNSVSGTGRVRDDSNIDLSAQPGDGSSIPAIAAAILGGGGLAGANWLFGNGNTKPNPPFTAEGVDPMQAKPSYLAEGVDPLQRSIAKAVPDIPIGGPGGIAPVAPSVVANAPQGPTTPVINEANIRDRLVPPPQIPLRPRLPGALRVPGGPLPMRETPRFTIPR